MRRFNVESLSAKDALLNSVAIWFAVRERRNTKRAKVQGYVTVASRAQRLYLHWWFAGADPRRALNRCPWCYGRGVGRRGHTCSNCRGTGRRV